MDDSRERASPQVRAADASCEQCGSCKQLAGSDLSGLRAADIRGLDRHIRWHVQANAPRRVTGGMKNLSFVPAPTDQITFAHQLVDLHFLRRFPSKPCCLDV